MEYRPLDITVISAEALKNVNTFSKMDVYVVVSIAGEQKATRKKTHTDRECGSNPRWNHRLKFTLDETTLYWKTLIFQIRADRNLGDRDVGEVTVPIRDLLVDSARASATDCYDEQVVDYQVRTNSGRVKGTLKFSYKFGEKFIQSADANNAHKPVNANHHHHMPFMPYPWHSNLSFPPPPPSRLGYSVPAQLLMSPYPPPVFTPYPPLSMYPPAPPGYGYLMSPPPMGYGYHPPPPPQPQMAEALVQQPQREREAEAQ